MMKVSRALVVLLFFIFQIVESSNSTAQNMNKLLTPDSIEIYPSLKLNAITFRGLSVFNVQTLICSGTKGVIGLSKNQGKDFVFKQINAYKRSDFRDAHLFGKQKAIISSAGFPAVVLKTNDAGENWKPVFLSADSSIFIDGFDFYGKKGILLADPVKGKFMVYYSKNEGDSWSLIDTALAPKAVESEAAFAASGTAIKWIDKESFAFVSGGKSSNLYCYQMRNRKWQKLALPILYGSAAQGAFSLTSFKQDTKNYLLIVGGDYTSDSISAMYSSICLVDLEKFQVIATASSLPFQSCVKEISTGVFFSTGNNSSQLFKLENNQIQILKQFSTGFHVIAVAGKKLFLAGAKGKIAEIEIP